MITMQNHIAHFQDRENTPIDMIVLHYISAINVMPQEPFNLARCIKILEDMGFSYNFMVGRQGEWVELVPEAFASIGNGRSKWKIKSGFHKKKKWTNNRSVTVAVIGMDGTKFTPYQYETVIIKTGDIVRRRDIKEDMFISHEHISPGRKIDIGRYWDWNRVYDPIYRPGVTAMDKQIAPVVEPEPSRLSSGKESNNFVRSLSAIMDVLNKLFKKE